jgi:hypothetical protein
MKFLKGMYEGLGNSKGQRFWRLFLILALISAVLTAGFYFDAISFVFSIGASK